MCETELNGPQNWLLPSSKSLVDTNSESIVLAENGTSRKVCIFVKIGKLQKSKKSPGPRFVRIQTLGTKRSVGDIYIQKRSVGDLQMLLSQRPIHKALQGAVSSILTALCVLRSNRCTLVTIHKTRISREFAFGTRTKKSQRKCDGRTLKSRPCRIRT